MVIKNVELETVCGITSTLPENTMMEVAFAGKSNVGKSSMINTIMNRKSLARTSSQPGKTQTINYYNVNQEFYLVDLPGYGYTHASVDARMKWGKMIENYLHTSKMLFAVFLLVDIRHEPNANDKQMFDWIIESGYHPLIIATKADKLKRSQVPKQLAMLRKSLGMRPDEILIPFSSETKQGKEEIYEIIDDMLAQFNAPEEPIE
ncbi:MAG: ribosome biogenesis GTP-binding protein YihA/YsxC [Lachnospiraceae bacterium]|nr:ribosome biogenesis GTP-binding protein YihA/YsxC [Lachnospiraceae bacterium]